MNNDYLRHGKEYPATVQAMLVWLTKQRGGSSKSKLDDATDGVTSFAQLECIVCRHCQGTGHFAWDCFKVLAQQREQYCQATRKREEFQAKFSDDSSVGSQGSVSSAGSNASNGSSTSGSTSGNVRSKGRRPDTPRRKPRSGVFEMSNFAFGTEGRSSAFG